ncbi:MAG: hypothetical protein IH631_03210, partial [Candidatus Thorarchaeota archaeon]|nr:hypothetical protein [Candidatus Thorarchaeota archaeon]
LLGVPHFETLSRQQLRDSVRSIGLSNVDVFESSWSVKCLFCVDATECQNPKRTDNIDFVIKQIDEGLDRVREHSSYDELKKEAESLKERVRIDGSSSASLMYFFGKK